MSMLLIKVFANPTYRIALTGDISCSSNGQNTVNQINNQNPNMVLWLGDLSYNKTSMDCFISQSSQLASKDEAIIGNHDDVESGSSISRAQLINYFGLPSAGYYSKTFDVAGTLRADDILLVGMDSQSSMTNSSQQYAFVKKSIQYSNSPLKIVIIHKPFLTCTCSHAPNGQFSSYNALFKQYGVDIVMQAHNHNIQYFDTIDNVKYIVSGAGGKSHYALTLSPQPAHYRNSASYGFTLIDADFGIHKLVGKFITNSGSDQSSSHFTQTFAPLPAYNYAPIFSATGSNYFDVSSSPSLQLSQFSVAAWFKTSSNFGSDALIVNKGGIGSDSAGENMNYGIWMTSSEQIRAGFETSSGTNFFVTSPTAYNNQWHYVVVTYSGSTVILYIDGVKIGTKSTSGALPETSAKPIRIASNSRITPPPASNFFTGNVDEVRVWKDDLTATEVANAFAGTNFNTSEQVLYLNFANMQSTTSGAYVYEPSMTPSIP